MQQIHLRKTGRPRLLPMPAILLVMLLLGSPVQAQDLGASRSDTTFTLRYPIRPISEFPYTFSRIQSPLFLRQPANFKSTIEFDQEFYEYRFSDKIGDFPVRQPFSMNLEEYRSYEFDRSINNYWKQRVEGEAFESQQGLIPKLYVGGEAFDRIFGSNTINIKPQGSAELRFGIQINNTENPALPERVRRNTTFDFDNKIQMNVTGQIGDKLQLGINYNTEATFDFENKTRIAYTGKEDEIIKKLRRVMSTCL